MHGILNVITVITSFSGTLFTMLPIIGGLWEVAFGFDKINVAV